MVHEISMVANYSYVCVCVCVCVCVSTLRSICNLLVALHTEDGNFNLLTVYFLYTYLLLTAGTVMLL